MAYRKETIDISTIEEDVKGVTKKKRKRGDSGLMVNDGDGITPFIQQKLDILEWDEIDTNNARDVKDRLSLYIQDCVARSIKPSVAGMSLALGIDRRTLWTWISGVTPKPSDVMVQLKKYYGLICGLYEDYMNNGKINPVSGIFLMKQIGYTDTQEIVVQAKDPLGELKSAEAIEQRYLEDVES